MSRLAGLLLALVASVLLYTAVFSVVRRPLTVGEVPVMLDRKLAHAAALRGPKLVVLAGSNGRYSHRCAEIAAAAGRPCSNLSVAVGIGLDFQLDLADTVLAPGDVLYMPLEYSQYALSRLLMESGTENALLVHYYPQRLAALPLERQLRARGSFDLPFLVHGLLENALVARQVRRRTGPETLTLEGDEQGHSRARSAPYQAWLAATRHVEAPLADDSHAMQVLAARLDGLRRRGVVVVGGWPTLPADAVVPAATLERVRELWASHGDGFVELPSASRHPRDCFFDTHSHLVEECQLVHSREVGRALRRWTAKASA